MAAHLSLLNNALINQNPARGSQARTALSTKGWGKKETDWCATAFVRSLLRAFERYPVWADKLLDWWKAYVILVHQVQPLTQSNIGRSTGMPMWRSRTMMRTAQPT